MTAEDAAPGDAFGSSVAISATDVLIGSPLADGAAGPDSGAAYVFARNDGTFTLQAKLTAGDGAALDQFGSAVAINGDFAIAGAPFADLPNAANAGSAYAFSRTGGTWRQDAKFGAGALSAQTRFGGALALDGSRLLVGTGAQDTSASVYYFQLGELPQILTQPLSRTAMPDTQVSFAIAANGFAPLTYQWRRNGVPITGANAATLDIQVPETSPFDAVEGIYDVTVTNLGGTVTSAPATLKVNALSQLNRVLAAPTAANGSIFVALSPSGPLGSTGIPGGWRFVGEQEWRPGGVSVGGLTPGDREVEFRPVPGFFQPLRENVSITGNGVAVVLSREYYNDTSTRTGGVSVTLKPDAIADAGLPSAERAQWRLLGQGDNDWRDSGSMLSGLPAGFYLIEAKAVAGFSTPPPLQIKVVDGQVSAGTATYFLADAPAGATPAIVPRETVMSSSSLPYQFVGEIRSGVGVSTGFAVKSRVVATAGHVVFDDALLCSAPLGTPTVTSEDLAPFGASGVQWLLQRDRGSFEPKPLIPRGYYALNGYAAQRIVDRTPGTSTPGSQHLDVAALYFLVDAAEGGRSGFLASDATDNEFLLSDALKTLIGYPVAGATPLASRGRMHATPPANVRFSRVPGVTRVPGEEQDRPFRTYSTTDITSFGGNSGGPLCVQLEDGTYYPAAIYLGGSAETVVRAIDGQVVDLLARAETSANGGDNNTSGGIAQVNSPLAAAAFSPAQLRVTLRPAAAVAVGAKWRLKGGTEWRESGELLLGLSAGKYALEFTTVGGFDAPRNATATLSAGTLAAVTATYATPPAPPQLPASAAASGARGVAGFAYTPPVRGAASGFTISVGRGETLQTLGLTFDAVTGRLSGTPAKAGEFAITLVASNSIGRSKPLALTLRFGEPGRLVLLVDSGRGAVAVTPRRPNNLFLPTDRITLTAAANKPAFLFAGWRFDGVMPSTLAEPVTRFSFAQAQPTVTVTPDFVENPFFTAAGNYAGRLAPAAPSLEHLGFVSLKLTKLGALSGSLKLGSATYAVKTQFDLDGATPPLQLASSVALRELRLETSPLSAARIRGTLDLDTLSIPFVLDRAVFERRLNPAPQATVDAQTGRPSPATYTVAILRAAPRTADLEPIAPGYGTATVTPDGIVRFVGTLGDGSSASAGAFITEEGKWPFHALLYQQRGVISGDAAFSETALSDLDGSLTWIKPPIAGPATTYPGGFACACSITGARFSNRAPLPGRLQVNLENAPPGSPATLELTLDEAGKASGPFGFVFALKRTSGEFSGSLGENGVAARNFRGIYLQKPGKGYGVFTGDPLSSGGLSTGAILIQVAP